MAYYLTDPYYYLPKSEPYTSVSPSCFYNGEVSHRITQHAQQI